MPKYIDSEVLGKSADMGYFITEYADHVLTVGYKDDNKSPHSHRSAPQKKHYKMSVPATMPS